MQARSSPSSLVYIQMYKGWCLFLTLGLADIMCLQVSLGGNFTDLHGHSVFVQFAVSNDTATSFQYTKARETKKCVAKFC